MSKALKALFCEHPASVDETYTEHMAAASGFALRLFAASVVCAVHAVLPFLFVKTGSTMIEENVVASAGTAYRMSQEEMEHLIEQAGYEPRQRTNLYERFVTREDTAEMARKYRGSLTVENRDLAGSLPIVA